MSVAADTIPAKPRRRLPGNVRIKAFAYLLVAPAILLICGLVSATFLTLFVLPTVYAFVYRKEEPAPPSDGGQEPAADIGGDAAEPQGAA